jgi:Domain of unknown function (DUF4062)
MRIFVSSSFEDLREHRAAVIRVLRQLGHELLAMEDLTAASAAPLAKVLDMVDRSEAYVGLFAWRYGYVPGANADPVTGQQSTAPGPQPPVPGPYGQVPQVEDAIFGETSITHYEYLRARQRKLPIMAFLLDEQFAWPPLLIDGFDTTRPKAPANSARIRALRQQLQQERVVSWFTTPSDLEARVGAAVTMAGLTSQLDLQTANALESAVGSASDSSAREGIKNAIVGAARGDQCALKIDLATAWWSTRLFLLAALAERLTQVRRILIVDTASADAGAVTAAAAGGGSAAPSVTTGAKAKSSIVEERFIGQIATGAILSIIGPKRTELGQFQSWLQGRSMAFDDLKTEIEESLVQWEKLFADAPFNPINEGKAKTELTTELLLRWFRDTMLQQPLQIADLQRASVVDLLRLLDYPSDYVPVRTRHQPEKEGDPVLERVDVMDKKALNRRLARSYLVELMDRARIGRNTQ